ncbi:MAG: hypothetical protein A2901_07765 [Elusimicrobia bacterium RIFCSPLOWO2_01_FULL_54_10]|nr:MAG: hypothetical protein A2901_07765 [Elusimicrobia bacterium RIFCSPLOWO2_01_FULL_54_10]
MTHVVEKKPPVPLRERSVEQLARLLLKTKKDQAKAAVARWAAIARHEHFVAREREILAALAYAAEGS